MPERKLCLSLIDQQHIRDPALGLNEPSGLSLNADGTALYTVSDDSKAIFRLSLNGSVDAAASFLIDSNQLEGLAISGDGKHIHTVQEGSNSVISYDITSRREITRRSLTDMANYRSVAKHFEQSPANKGLEGITVNTKSGHIVVLKEGQPGLLIDINLSEGRINSSRLLSDTNGFSHSQISKKSWTFLASATTAVAIRSGSAATRGSACTTTTGSEITCCRGWSSLARQGKDPAKCARLRASPSTRSGNASMW